MHPAADANATPTDGASTGADALTAGDTTGVIDMDTTPIDATDTNPIDAAQGLRVRASPAHHTCPTTCAKYLDDPAQLALAMARTAA